MNAKEVNMNIYVGNLSWDATEGELRGEFEAFGQVTSVRIIKDKFSGQSKGFGFVEMASVAEGQAAINGLNGKELKGRALKVNPAQERSQGQRGGERKGGGGRKGGYGKGGGRRSW